MGVLVVGEYPEAEEDREGEQFVGGSGSYLEEVVDRLGFDLRRDCVLTNAAICHGAHDHKTAVSDCAPTLRKTIREVDPRVIILLGGAAVRSLVGSLWKASDVGGIGKWVGYRIPCTKPNAWVCPAHNPAYVLRNKDDPVLVAEFREHLKAALTSPGRPWPDGPPDYEKAAEVVLDPSEAARRLSLITDGVISFDYETDRLKPDHPAADLVCASVCADGKTSFAFPWHGGVKVHMKRILTDPGIGKIGWNNKFEDRWTRRFLGVRVVGWVWDGMLAAHALDPRSGVTGLKFQAFARLGCPDYSGHLEDFLQSREKGGNAPNRVREIGLSALLRYCAVDSLLEYKLALLQADDVGVTLE